MKLSAHTQTITQRSHGLLDGSIIILGIDPGLAETGWGVVQTQANGRALMLDCGVVVTAAGGPLAARLHHIFQELQKLIQRYRPAVMSVEQLFFARNAKTAMVVAHGRAAALLAAGAAGIEVVEYTPLQLKLALTGKGSAGKAQVQQMVRAVLGLKELPKPDHAADALAAALCHAHSLRVTQAVAAGRGKVKVVEEDGARETRKALLAKMRR